MTVLYVDGVGPFGGASRSLFEMLRAGNRDRFRRLFLVQTGTASHYYRQIGDDFVTTRGVARFDNTQFSHYTGARWLVLLREILYIPFTIWALFRARLKWRAVDVIHANEVLEIIPAIIASKMYRAPLVVHVRSVQWRNWRSWRTRLLHALLRRYVAQIVAIDDGVRASLPPDLNVVVVHNSFEPKPADVPDTALRAKLAALSQTDAIKVGFVGNLHASKGVDCLIDAAEILVQSGRRCEFLMIGGNTASGRGVLWRILDLLGLAQNRGDAIGKRLMLSPARDTIHQLGATGDIDALYRSIDVLIFPSHFDAPGRPVFEAAFYCVPSIVAVREPFADTLVNGITGIAIAGPDGALLADALSRMDDNRAATKMMGSAARELAQRNFLPGDNAARMEAIYEAVLNAR